MTNSTETNNTNSQTQGTENVNPPVDTEAPFNIFQFLKHRLLERIIMHDMEFPEDLSTINFDAEFLKMKTPKLIHAMTRGFDLGILFSASVIEKIEAEEIKAARLAKESQEQKETISKLQEEIDSFKEILKPKSIMDEIIIENLKNNKSARPDIYQSHIPIISSNDSSEIFKEPLKPFRPAPTIIDDVEEEVIDLIKDDKEYMEEKDFLDLVKDRCEAVVEATDEQKLKELSEIPHLPEDKEMPCEDSKDSGDSSEDHF